MSKNNVISLENPAGNTDLLTGLLRSGARELIMKAVQSELTEFLSQLIGPVRPLIGSLRGFRFIRISV